MPQKTVTVTFYAEHKDNRPETWSSPRPAFNVSRFQAELDRRGGMIGSIPRFRLRWAGECDEYILDEYSELKGYSYVENGEDKFVSCLDGDFELPDGAVAVPVTEDHKVFTPRWVIEEYREPFYQKWWTIHEIEQVGYQSGRVDLMSHYRQPSEVDLETVEAYVAAKATLNADDMRNGLAIQDAMAKREEDAKREEFVAETAEQFNKAMKDGLPNPTVFGMSSKRKKFDPNFQFDIKKHTKNLIKEHDKTI